MRENSEIIVVKSEKQLENDKCMHRRELSSAIKIYYCAYRYYINAFIVIVIEKRYHIVCVCLYMQVPNVFCAAWWLHLDFE